MADVVLVHGIDQQQRSAESLEAEWVPDLAGGIRISGFPQIADLIWRARGGLAEIDTRMAFYGDLFLVAGQQGDDEEELNHEEMILADQIAIEWLERASNRATSVKNRECAVRELSYLRDDIGHEAQGPRELARKAIKSAARLLWFARFGMAFAERFVFRALAQVTKYLTSESIRTEVQARVSSLITSETKVIIGYSLGSVVAFEVAHQQNQRLPILVTIGSPLGLETIVYQKLRPQPPTFPALVDRWVNIADRNDFVAAEPDVTTMFAESVPSSAVFEGHWIVDNGSEPHRANFYLTKREVGRPVAQTIAGAIH